MAAAGRQHLLGWDRSFCHTFVRGEGKHQMVPGRPYSIEAAPATGRTSWTALLNAVRLEPGADVAAVTTAQIRELFERLVAAGQWKPGDPEVLVVLDAGYDAPRIAHLLHDLPSRSSAGSARTVSCAGRRRHASTPPKGRPTTQARRRVRLRRFRHLGHRAGRDGHRHRLYGKATAQAWDRLHPRLTRRTAWTHRPAGATRTVLSATAALRCWPVLEAIRVPRLGIGRPRKRPDRVRADKAYDSRRGSAPVRVAHRSSTSSPSATRRPCWSQSSTNGLALTKSRLSGLAHQSRVAISSSTSASVNP